MTSLIDSLPRLSRWLVSDGSAPAHPAVIEAVVAANEGHARGYGADRWTAAAKDSFAALFGHRSKVFLTMNGTGSNVMALAALLQPAEAVVCPARAHISVDETGAPERFLGAKILAVESSDGKLVPDQLRDLRGLQGNPHHAQPGVLSISQCTEFGTVYEPDEIAALCRTAHDMGMRVHMDGARIANAVAILGADRAALRSFTVDAGVDVLTFGGTKNGLLGAEAVVFLNEDVASRAHYLHKQVNQLASKTRYLAAQFLAILADDLWIDLAAHANSMAQLLWSHTTDIAGISHDKPPVVNSLFPYLVPRMVEPLRAWCPFLDWNPDRSQVRWMTAWDMSVADVGQLAHGIQQFSLELGG